MLNVTQFPMQIVTESTVVGVVGVRPQFPVLRVDLTFRFLSTTACHQLLTVYMYEPQKILLLLLLLLLLL